MGKNANRGEGFGVALRGFSKKRENKKEVMVDSKFIFSLTGRRPTLIILCKLQHHRTAEQLSNEWSHFRVLSIESKVRKLCINQGFTVEVKELNITFFKYL